MVLYSQNFAVTFTSYVIENLVNDQMLLKHHVFQLAASLPAPSLPTFCAIFPKMLKIFISFLKKMLDCYIWFSPELFCINDRP